MVLSLEVCNPGSQNICHREEGHRSGRVDLLADEVVDDSAGQGFSLASSCAGDDSYMPLVAEHGTALVGR